MCEIVFEIGDGWGRFFNGRVINHNEMIYFSAIFPLMQTF
jgi:hypothetical protein